MAKEVTTVKISKNAIELLSRLKIHPRQPYEEVVLKLIQERDESKKFSQIDFEVSKKITTIKLTKKTASILNGLKIHPRQPYEEVILNLISQNEEARKKAR